MFSTSDRFAQVFKVLIGVEGGYVNSPNDPGGETKFGISKRSYPHLNIKMLTVDQAMEIYWTDFWLKLGCDKLPKGLDRFVFDFGVNSGVPTVARKLQLAAGTAVDGVVGPNTIKAVLNKGVDQVFRTLFLERAIIFAQAKPNVFSENARGWYGRLHDMTYTYYVERG